MIFELMTKGLISKKNLLISNYIKLGLNENQTMIILIIMDLSRNDKVFVTPELLAKHMTLSEEEIEKEIDYLIENNFLKIESKKIDLSPLFIRLFSLLEQYFLSHENSDIYEIINLKLKTKLSDDQKKELSSTINVNISKYELIKIINENDFKTYKDFTKILTKFLTKEMIDK